MRTLALAVASACTAPLDAASPYRPVVMMHGLGGNHEKYDDKIDALKAQYPGIYVTALPLYEGMSSGYTPMDKQLAAVVEAVQSDGNLTKGFNFYGESQGGLLARAYVTTVNDPPVHNLISINGPQDGVGECPYVEWGSLKHLCGDLGDDLHIYHWPVCSFCGYWRGKRQDVYLENSQWMADINNDREVNQTRRENMMSLNKYMATVALDDHVVQPRESAWHTHWYWGDDERVRVVPYSETDGYKNDVLGLRTLDQRGDLILNSFNGSHTGYSTSWWTENVLPMFDNRLPGEVESGEAAVVVV